MKWITHTLSWNLRKRRWWSFKNKNICIFFGNLGIFWCTWSMLSEGCHPNDIKMVVRSHNQFCPDTAKIYMWPEAMRLIPSIVTYYYHFYRTLCYIQLTFLFLPTLLYNVKLENEKVMVHNNIHSHIISYDHLNWSHTKEMVISSSWTH